MQRRFRALVIFAVFTGPHMGEWLSCAPEVLISR